MTITKIKALLAEGKDNEGKVCEIDQKRWLEWPSFLQIVDNSQYLQKLIFNKFRANIYQFIVTIKDINIAKNC